MCPDLIMTLDKRFLDDLPDLAERSGFELDSETTCRHVPSPTTDDTTEAYLEVSGTITILDEHFDYYMFVLEDSIHFRIKNIFSAKQLESIVDLIDDAFAPYDLGKRND